MSRPRRNHKARELIRRIWRAFSEGQSAKQIANEEGQVQEMIEAIIRERTRKAGRTGGR